MIDSLALARALRASAPTDLEPYLRGRDLLGLRIEQARLAGHRVGVACVERDGGSVYGHAACADCGAAVGTTLFGRARPDCLDAVLRPCTGGAP